MKTVLPNSKTEFEIMRPYTCHHIMRAHSSEILLQIQKYCLYRLHEVPKNLLSQFCIRIRGTVKTVVSIFYEDSSSVSVSVFNALLVCINWLFRKNKCMSIQMCNAFKSASNHALIDALRMHFKSALFPFGHHQW